MLKSIARIVAQKPQKRTKKILFSFGTGSIIHVPELGFCVLTCSHAVDGADSIEIESDVLKKTRCKILFQSREYDVAILKAADAIDLPPLSLNANVSTDECLTMIGCGYGRITPQTIVTRVMQKKVTEFSVDVPARKGESGGPLVNKNGVIVGMVKESGKYRTICVNTRLIERVIEVAKSVSNG